jgi:hypothetical protein
MGGTDWFVHGCIYLRLLLMRLQPLHAEAAADEAAGADKLDMWAISHLT